MTCKGCGYGQSSCLCDPLFGSRHPASLYREILEQNVARERAFVGEVLKRVGFIYAHKELGLTRLGLRLAMTRLGLLSKGV